MKKQPVDISRFVRVLVALAIVLVGAFAFGETYGPELEGFEYPFRVSHYKFQSQHQELSMAYMDVPAPHPNGKVAVLLHGKNFCAATWKDTIDTLTQAGYRVIAPDQIGFCKSTKPKSYQFSFQQLARNTRALLDKLHIEQFTLMGHSTGGMLAIRYALMFPTSVTQLVLVDPIGLEDWKAKGVPSISIDEWNERELKTNAEKIRAYEKSTYYAGSWSQRYDPWVQMLAGLNKGRGRDLVAWNSALIYDMIYTQPVIYELNQIAVPTLLMIGDKDTTAIGKDLATAEVRATLGHYPELAKEAVKEIPGAKLVEFENLGHAPQMQDPKLFHEKLLAGLLPITATSPTPKMDAAPVKTPEHK